MTKGPAYIHNSNIIRGYTTSENIRKPCIANYDAILDDLRFSALSTMYRAVEEFQAKIYPTYGISKRALLTGLRSRIVSMQKDDLRKLHVKYHTEGTEAFINLIIYPNGKRKKRLTKEGNRRSAIFDDQND